jgi:hypothetical protein
MSPHEKHGLNLKKAFADLAARSAPAAPDLGRAMASAPGTRTSLPQVRMRWALIPLAAAFALCLGGALIATRFFGPARGVYPAAMTLDRDYLVSPARDQAAAGVGLSPFRAEGEETAVSGETGIESDLLTYIEALWTLPGQAPEELSDIGI